MNVVYGLYLSATSNNEELLLIKGLKVQKGTAVTAIDKRNINHFSLYFEK